MAVMKGGHVLQSGSPDDICVAGTAVGKLTARPPGHPRDHVGDRVFLHWQPERAHLFDAASERRLA